MMFNGEMIIAEGIKYALELEGIPENQHGAITRKIINYFAVRSKKASERLKNASKQRHKRKF